MIYLSTAASALLEAAYGRLGANSFGLRFQSLVVEALKAHPRLHDLYDNRGAGQPDCFAILERYGFGRAHHRVLHFVHRNPGLKVAELLDVLKITKQSLARVLKELREKGFITQRPGPDDLRERRLYLTPKGVRLTDKLTELQVRRIAGALREAGSQADEVTRRFLLAMIEPQERDQVASLVRWSGTAITEP